MRALFMRGRFTAADATAASQTLAAYALGLLPFVLIRSVTATFLARGDTATPMKASLTAVGVNVGFKAAFYYLTALAQVGLALATSIGAWLNLGLVIWFAARRGHLAFDPALRSATVRLTTAGLALAAVLWLTHAPVARLFADWTSWRDESTLAISFSKLGAGLTTDVVDGSDYPYDMSDVDPVRAIASLPHLSDRERELIYGGNAMQLFRIEG